MRDSAAATAHFAGLGNQPKRYHQHAALWTCSACVIAYDNSSNAGLVNQSKQCQQHVTSRTCNVCFSCYNSMICWPSQPAKAIRQLWRQHVTSQTRNACLNFYNSTLCWPSQPAKAMRQEWRQHASSQTRNACISYYKQQHSAGLDNQPKHWWRRDPLTSGQCVFNYQSSKVCWPRKPAQACSRR
jgi:uncharacterized protein YbdZ (MbtH family)